MDATEQALAFDCAGDSLVGVLHRPAAPSSDIGDVGVVVVVGGPQYRAGSHRQFVHLARALAAAGCTVLRFDVRGMGDASGELHDFRSLDDDIAAAIGALCRHAPSVRRVVLWGLCDGASAALLYLHARTDRRVRGVCLLNPWVRSTATLARTHVKHYYTRRILEREFWRKLLRGGVAFAALREFGRNLKRASGRAEASAELSFQERMRRALETSDLAALLVLSGEDYTAKEFIEYTRGDPRWGEVLARCERRDVAGADHTFSGAEARRSVEQATLAWLQRLPARVAEDATR